MGIGAGGRTSGRQSNANEPWTQWTRWDGNFLVFSTLGLWGLGGLGFYKKSGNQKVKYSMTQRISTPFRAHAQRKVANFGGPPRPLGNPAPALGNLGKSTLDQGWTTLDLNP